MVVDSAVVDLVTYRKNGTGVTTPVLATPRNGKILVRTHATAGKLKRLRWSAEVELIPVEGRRRRVEGSLHGTAKILPASENAACVALVHKRHGLAARAARVLQRLRGPGDVFIEVTPG